MPPCELTAAVFLAALFANCLRGALAPVFFLAVYFVRAILTTFFFIIRSISELIGPFKGCSSQLLTPDYFDPGASIM